MTKKPAASVAPDGTQIFKATYSGVPVFEMICKTVAVMRRRSDSWLNATQILKVAGFDKPQRTRVLEREVQKGEHEKVQGGYGKYQGTWIPIERGLALSQQYNVEELMRPIIDYIPTADSPPLAPKHITAAPTRNPNKKPKMEPSVQSSALSGPSTDSTPDKQSARQIARSAKAEATAQAKAEAATILASEKKERKEREKGEKKAEAERAARQASLEMRSASDGDSLSDSPSLESESSRTPSPILGSDDLDNDWSSTAGGGGSRKRKFKDAYEPSSSRARVHAAADVSLSSDPAPYADEYAGGTGQERYIEIILDYFITESSQIPSILINPPLDYDANAVIDDEGHTSLHWACAMGRLRVVKLLLAAGADVFRVNTSEQTPLMRSVMFSNNYDVRKFPDMYELLHRTTLNIDKNHRTVFHHIADTALSKGKTLAARYYMDSILRRLKDYPKELSDMVNYQDDEGETALTLAARARTRRLVKSLLDHGADPKLANRDGKSAEDYIVEDERYRSSPVHGQSGSGANSNGATNGSKDAFGGGGSSRIYRSSTAQLAAGQTTVEVAALLTSLARSFDLELQSKERDLTQPASLLTSINLDIASTKRESEAVKLKLGDQLDVSLSHLSAVQNDLDSTLSSRYSIGYQAWAAAQLSREEAFRSGAPPPPSRSSVGAGEDLSDIGRLFTLPPDDGSGALEAEAAALTTGIEARKARRAELFATYIGMQTEVGTGEEMDKYRRIVRAAAGVGEGEEDLDETVEALLEALESDQAASIPDSAPPQSHPSTRQHLAHAYSSPSAQHAHIPPPMHYSTPSGMD